MMGIREFRCSVHYKSVLAKDDNQVKKNASRTNGLMKKKSTKYVVGDEPNKTC